MTQPAPGSSKPLRVLFVQKPVMGGAAESLVQLVQAVRGSVEPVVLFHWENDYVGRIADLGVEVRVLHSGRTRGTRSGTGADPTSAPGQPAGPGGMPAKRSAVREWMQFVRRDLSAVGRIAGILRELRPDLVHHNNHPFADRASILAAWRCRLPQVAHVRSLPPFYPPIDRRVARMPTTLVCVSNAVREHCRAVLGLPAAALEVVHDCVQPADAVQEHSKSELRLRLNLPDEGPLLLNVGRLVPFKGQADFLRAAAELTKQHPSLQAVLLGEPGRTPQGEEYARHLEALARELGISERTHFVGHRDDVLDFMRAADLLLHTPTGPEAFGRILAEAMSVGCPVVTTDVGGVGDIVEHGVNGLLTPAEDVARIASAAGDLLADDAARDRFAERGLEHVRESFSQAAHAPRILAIYRQLRTA